MTDAERSKEIDLCRSYVRDVKRKFESLGIFVRRSDHYPFDLVALSVLNKAFSLSDATFLLIDANMDDQAFALCRSIVECALTLRHITAEPDKIFERSKDYVKFEMTEKQTWMFYALELKKGTPREAVLLEHGKKEGIVPDERGAGKHWSGKQGFAKVTNLVDHPLDDGATELTKKVRYAVDYSQTSAYVHCSAPAVSNFIPDNFEQFRFGEKSGRSRFQKVLFTNLVYLHSCIAYTLFGLGISPRPEIFNDLFQKTLDSMAPLEREFD